MVSVAFAAMVVSVAFAVFLVVVDLTLIRVQIFFPLTTLQTSLVFGFVVAADAPFAPSDAARRRAAATARWRMGERLVFTLSNVRTAGLRPS